MKTRREFLKAAGAAGAGAALAPHALTTLAGLPPQMLHFDGVAIGYGQYLYFPFTVPASPEVNRIDVNVTHDVNNSKVVKLGAGLFDQQGAQYQSAGFRRIYGEERHQFFVSAGSASQSFIPGTILPGTWTVVVPVFLAAIPTPVHVDIVLSFGSQLPDFVPGRYVLTRWIHACCAAGEAPISVRLVLSEPVGVGVWVEAEGRWRSGSGAQRLTPTVIRCDTVRVLDQPPPCREDHAHQD